MSWGISGRVGSPGPLPPASGTRPEASGSASMGKLSTSSRAGFAHELLVEVGDRGLVGEDQRDLGESAHALVEQGASGELDPALEVDRLVVLLVGGVDVEAHEERSYAATMSATIRWRTTSFAPR